ncbi:MAG: transposase [Lachnospiraceae bacterium]|nr:transposase [Lachnospiraceae bacterium]
MSQQTFADVEYSHRKKKTRREQFLTTLDAVIPWDHWVSVIRPYYVAGRRGRPPRGIETMLRMYLLRKWFSLSDKAIEDAVYDSYAMRGFLKLDFLDKQVPGASTLLRFRHLLEENGIAQEIFEDTDRRLREAGYILHCGSVADPALVALPKRPEKK